jgi:hypothetical protein
MPTVDARLARVRDLPPALPLPPPPPTGTISISEPLPEAPRRLEEVPIARAAPAVHGPRHGALVAVVVLAAILGSLAVWLAMRGGAEDGPSRSPAIDEARVSIDSRRDRVTAHAIDEPTLDATAHAGAPSVAPELAPDAAAPPPSDEAIVAACMRDLTIDRAASCTRAACRLGLAPRARQFYAKLPRDERRLVLAACRADGIELAPRPQRPGAVRDAGAVDPCALDPMACQD